MNRLRRSLLPLAIGAIVMATGTAFGVRIGIAIADTAPVGGTQALVMAALATEGSTDLRDRYALAMDDGVLTVGEERDLYAMIDGQLGIDRTPQGRPGGRVVMRDDDAVTSDMI